MYKITYPNNTKNLLDGNKDAQFLELLKSKWDELHQETDIFRYKIDNLEERITDDGYLLQLNPDRNSKRRTPEEISDICQPFDGKKFNFLKASDKEKMFNLMQVQNETDIQKHTILVNVSPISRYHSLLCPSIGKCLPQVVTRQSLELALDIMFMTSDRALRIGFNSLCAFASVNHLHYHLFLENNTLPVEILECKHIKGPLYQLDEEYPAPAFCFQIPTTDAIAESSKDIYKVIEHFLKKSIAHNIYITRGHNLVQGDQEVVRFLLWPRKSSSGVKKLAAFNVAVCELSGWFPIFNKQDYDNLKTQDLEKELSKWKLDNFDDLCAEVKLLF